MNNSLFRMFTVIVYMTTLCSTVAAQTKDSVYSSRTDWAERIRSPYISVQQLLKGVVPGLYVQENSGEPGTIQGMLLRGLTTPVFSNQDVSGNRPIVYINGIPLLDDNSFSYGIKSNSINPVGSATNPLAGLDLDNITSIKVIKDPVELAKLGPMAANGAIWITVKDGWKGGSHVSLGAWMSYAAPPTDIKMTNGATEVAFRKQFYDAYGLNVNSYLPAYLSNNKDSYFFGKPNWADAYYQYAPQYNVNASIGGGDKKANYLFAVGTTTNKGVVSGVGFNKYNISFGINLMPLTGLTISTLANAIRMERKRNTNIRDRYAEVEYMPELITPISPTKVGYDSYLAAADLTKDNNVNNRIYGQMVIDYKYKGFYANASLRLDWNNNTRQAFFPSTLMESVNFVSDYWGYNRRMNATANIGYNLLFSELHRLNVELGASYQQDFHHYNYTRAFDGADDLKPTTSSGNFAYLYRYTDELDYRLLSEFISFDYSFKEYINLNAIFRQDGTSNMQANHRWLFSPAFSAKWNLKKSLLQNATALSDLSLRGSWARVGKLYETDRFMVGPYYNSENINWQGQPLMASYYGFATITRPYSAGWSDYGFNWPTSDKWELELSASFFKNRLNASITYYSNTDKNMSIAIPVVQEMGYQYKYLNGMKVSNKGVEAELSANILSKSDFSWNASLNMAMNQNRLKALPDGIESVVIGDRKLEVGHSIDEFWLYKNNGIYTSDSEIPVKDGKKLSYLGSVPFNVGDPKWVDMNGDNVIDEDDKVLSGRSTPPLTGGFSSNIRWKQFDLGFQLFFALGHDAVNYRSSQRYDFTTLDEGNTLASAKEIFFWQNTNDKNGYPIYNPLSEVRPYQPHQDLFLEKLSYLKLRSVTLGYTVPIKVKKHTALTTLKSLYIYLSGNNLLTVSNFSGDDPELVDFDGYYRGYGQSIPRSVTLGVKLNF